MFITMPHFEQTGMSMLAGAGQKYWRGVTASPLEQHWYLFAYEGPVLDAWGDLDFLTPWEETLIGFINRVPEQDRRAVYRIDRGEAGRRVFRMVQAIWNPASEEERDGVVAVLELEGEQELVDAHLKPLPKARERRLVFEARTAAQRRTFTDESGADRN